MLYRNRLSKWSNRRLRKWILVRSILITTSVGFDVWAEGEANNHEIETYRTIYGFSVIDGKQVFEFKQDPYADRCRLIRRLRNYIFLNFIKNRLFSEFFCLRLSLARRVLSTFSCSRHVTVYPLLEKQVFPLSLSALLKKYVEKTHRKHNINFFK